MAISTGGSLHFVQEMKEGRVDKSPLITGPRARLKGSLTDGVKWDVVKFTYHYSHVPNTDYSFAFVLTEDDKLQYELQDFSYQENQGPEYYHEIQKFSKEKQENELKVSSTQKYYDHVTIATAKSTVKLAPRAFCDPTRYVLSGEPRFPYMDSFLNSNTTPNIGCDKGGKILAGVRYVCFFFLLEVPVDGAQTSWLHQLEYNWWKVTDGNWLTNPLLLEI